MTAASDEQIVTSSEVRSELLRIIASPDFAASKQLTRFLEYIVDESLAGHAEILKERTVACRALGRGADFDPRLDCVVRVVAGKLRRSLDRYYTLQGMSDSLCIEVPKGTYCPVFRRRHENVSNRQGPDSAPTTVAAGGGAAARPIVAVVPLKSFTGGPKEQFLADLLADDVAVRLGRIRGLEVIDCLAMCSAWNGTEDSVHNRAEAKRQLRRQRVGEQGWPPRPADGSARRQPQRNLGLGRPVRSADRRRPLGAARPHCRSRCRWHPRVFQAWMKCSTATAVPRLPRRASGGDGRPPLATTILRQDRSSTRLLAFSLLGSEDSRKGFQLRCSQRPSLLSLRFELVGHRGRERYESLSVARASAPVCRSGAQAVRRWSLAVRFHPSPRLQPQS